MKHTNKTFPILICFVAVAIQAAFASAQVKQKKHWYFSWGYNSELWLPSNI